jgi:hypothetical protein
MTAGVVPTRVQSADGTDGADGMFGSSTHPDDPVSRSAFATERNVDAQCPQESLRTTQTASKGPGSFGQPVLFLKAPSLP